MAETFDTFVILAEMRTGSNFLEENVNDFKGLICLGELFNPHFVGHAGKKTIEGLTLAERETDPIGFLEKLRDKTKEKMGFRLFDGHDPRILKHVLNDRRCAKVVLTRNPVDSYVSLKIAGATGQWRLGDLKHAKTSKADFDADEFAAYLEERQTFHRHIQRSLQTSGQTGFFLDYDDLQDIDVLNGLAKFLGANTPKEKLSDKTKKQNPSVLEDKVTNFEALEGALRRADLFGLARSPVFEPRRAPVVPNYRAGAETPLLFMPVKAAPERRVADWLAALDGVPADQLTTQFSQKTLRNWKRRHPGHLSFTVVRHPLLRAHRAFLRHILTPGPSCFRETREVLRDRYKIPLPKGAPGKRWTRDDHRAAFLAFLEFLRGHLAGQTSLRIDGAWASQEAVLRGITSFAPPDRILREDRIEGELTALAGLYGKAAPPLAPPSPETPFSLADIYDPALEAAAAKTYQRDYMLFGFDAWSPQAEPVAA